MCEFSVNAESNVRALHSFNGNLLFTSIALHSVYFDPDTENVRFNFVIYKNVFKCTCNDL